MKAIAIQNGSAMDYTASAAISAGQLVMVGTVAGVAGSDIANGETGSLVVEGVFALAKDGAAINQGAKVYYKADDDVVTATASGAVAIGYAFKPAGASDAVCHVKLNA